MITIIRIIIALLVVATSFAPAFAGGKPAPPKRTGKEANDGKSPDKPVATAPRQEAPTSPTRTRATHATTPGGGQAFAAFAGQNETI